MVEEFERARKATSPSAVGAAMEKATRGQLEQILPRGIGVGSGFVIDSNGGTSRQVDIVLYERDICPIFSINNTPETTYYPCEGVIAVGEIKSILDKNSLDDSFKKIESVKRLVRSKIFHSIPAPETGEGIEMTRRYGNIQEHEILTIGETKNTNKIFGFVLADKIGMDRETYVEHFKGMAYERDDVLLPNFVAVLQGSLLTWGNLSREYLCKEWSDTSKNWVLVKRNTGEQKWQSVWSADEGEYCAERDCKEPFRELVIWIQAIFREGETSHARAFDRYFFGDTDDAKVNMRLIQKKKKSLG